MNPINAIIVFAATALAKLLPTKSVDGAISFVTKGLQALAAAEAAQNAQAVKLFDEASALEKRAEMLKEAGSSFSAEADRAKVIRANLVALVSAPAAADTVATA